MSSSSVDFAQPNPKNRLYDVFLSFRGEDTRYGFTFYLFESLKSNNVHTFMDVNNTGYDIEHLFEMVRKSKVAVVIFSENFASSKWCLKELELILQRRKDKKMLMIPIFYNINVHELQHLTGKTGEYLDRHIPKHGETTVQKWKDVVKTFGEISGLSNKLRYEYDFIAEVIVKTKHKIKEWEEILESTSNPYNSGQATEHDVFISFMGKDTLYGVVSRLYKALIEKDIKTFMDDQDHLKDETIVFELIQQSKIAVIVFSENYASSKWCLRELVKILQCKKDPKRQVVLIFFEISPSDLKQAVEGSRISYHLNEHARDELSNTVKSWRDAITDLGHIVGWRYSTAHSKRELADFIQGLVEEILTKLKRVEDEKEESNQQAHVSSAKLEENSQALAVQIDITSGPAYAEIRCAEDASGLIGDNSLVVVAVFTGGPGEEYDNFVELAEKLRSSEYQFAYTLDAKFLPCGDSLVSGSFVRIFKPFDQLFFDSKDFNVEALEKFVEESSLPVLTLIDTDPSLNLYAFKSQNVKAMLFMNFSNEVAESMKAKYREVAEQFKGHDISFLLLDLEARQQTFKYFGLKEEQAPVIVVNSNDGQKYVKANIEVDDIAPWVKDYKDGKVAPYTKSEPIPHDNNEPVKVVVADSIDDIVFKSGKNVLIEFYARSSEYCKRLAPILNEVALFFDSDPNIVIAKFDATSNDITSDAFKVYDYPTIYFRSSTGTILNHAGYRTKEDLIDFIEKNRVS